MERKINFIKYLPEEKIKTFIRQTLGYGIYPYGNKYTLLQPACCDDCQYTFGDFEVTGVEFGSPALSAQLFTSFHGYTSKPGLETFDTTGLTKEWNRFVFNSLKEQDESLAGKWLTEYTNFKKSKKENLNIR